MRKALPAQQPELSQRIRFIAELLRLAPQILTISRLPIPECLPWKPLARPTHTEQFQEIRERFFPQPPMTIAAPEAILLSVLASRPEARQL